MATQTFDYNGPKELGEFLSAAEGAGIRQILMRVRGGTTVIRESGMFYSAPTVQIVCSFEKITQQNEANPLADTAHEVLWGMEETIKTGRQERELIDSVESALRRRGFSVTTS